MIRIIKWLAVVSTIGMIFILLGGALVTKTGSGAGCGDSLLVMDNLFLTKSLLS